MKIKRWLSRGIVLAMVVALMVPMPVLAKSSKSGGKLIKDVTYYSYDNGTDGKYGTADDKYQLVSKTSYTYDKKKNPSERKYTYYTDFFLNIPVNGNVSTETYKYKYKGNTPKSMQVKNDIGYVVESNKYQKGKVSSYSGIDSLYADEKGEFSNKYSGTIVYDKNGLPKATCYVEGKTAENAYAGGSESNTVIYSVQKNGIPSYMFASGNYKEFDSKGAVEWQSLDNGSGRYASFNSKGLIVQSGWYDKETNKYNADYTFQYVMKKGNVAEAIIYYVGPVYDEETDELISETSNTAVGKYVFKYNKTKISKQRYMNMINDFVDRQMNCFFWY